MEPKSPQEVLRAVSNDFKNQGYTYADAAKILGIKSKQTLYNLLSSKKYMSGLQARRFQRAFGYNMDFLMSGEGILSPYSDNDTGKPFVIEDTREGDQEQILYWLGEFLSNQDNQEGLAFLAVVSRYFQARKIAEQKLRDYTGSASYKEAYDDLLSTLQSNILSKIEEMIRNARKGSD